jgi:hypothetical protein
MVWFASICIGRCIQAFDYYVEHTATPCYVMSCIYHRSILA